jgi:hypothetical protein
MEEAEHVKQGRRLVDKMGEWFEAEELETPYDILSVLSVAVMITMARLSPGMSVLRQQTDAFVMSLNDMLSTVEQQWETE